MKKIHCLLNYYQYQNANLSSYLEVFFRIFLSNFLAMLFHYYKLIIFKIYAEINIFYCKFK